MKIKNKFNKGCVSFYRYCRGMSANLCIMAALFMSGCVLGSRGDDGIADAAKEINDILN